MKEKGKIIGHRRTEEALKESEVKFRDLTEKSLVGIYLIQDGVFKYVNPKLAEILGYAVKELIEKKGPKDLALPEDWPIIEENIRKRISGEIESTNYQFRCITKNKEVIYVEVYGSRTMYEGRPAVIGTLLDITERKLAEEVIQQQSRDKATLLEVSQAIATSLDMKTVLQTIVESAINLAGLDSGAIYLLKGNELYLGATTPPLPPQFPEAFRRAMMGDHPHIHRAVSTRQPVILPDTAAADLSPAERTISEMRGLRTILYLPLLIEKRAVGTLILGTVGKTRSFSGADIELYSILSGYAAQAIVNAQLYEAVQQELAERRQAEEALSESEERYRTLAEAAQDMIFIIDSEGRVKYANSFAAKQLGCRPEEIVGKSQESLFPPETAERQKRNVKKIFETGEDIYVESAVPFPGYAAWLGTRLVPIKNGKGRVGAVLGISRDITERKKAEEALKESEEKFRTLAETAASAIFIYRDKFLYVNPAAEALAGYSSEEILQMYIWEIVPPDFRDMVIERAKARLEGKPVPSRYEFKIITKSGEERWVDFAAGLIHYKGALAGIGTAFDITEHKRADEELQKAHAELQHAYEELKSIERMKSDIISNISHELRTPLTIIKGAMELAMEEENKEEQKKLFALAMNAMARQSETVENLITLAWLRSGEQRLSLESIEFEPIAALVMRMVELKAVEKNIEVKTVIEKGLFVRADHKALRRVLYNLLDNAVKFNKNGGRMVIEAKRKDGMAEVCVADTGIGISGAHLPKLFTPLYQVDASITRSYTGTGTGLAASKQLVEAMGGAIRAESEAGKGSRFYFTLPLA